MAGDVDRVGTCLFVRVRAVVGGFDGEGVLAGGGLHPGGELVRRGGGGVGEGVGVRFHFHARAFIGGAADAHPAAGFLRGELVAVVKSALGNLRAVLFAGDVADPVEAEGLLGGHRCALRLGGGFELIRLVVGDVPGFRGVGAEGLRPGFDVSGGVILIDVLGKRDVAGAGVLDFLEAQVGGGGVVIQGGGEAVGGGEGFRHQVHRIVGLGEDPERVGELGDADH